MPETTQDQSPERPFMDLLRTLRDGGCLEDLSRALKQLNVAVATTGKAGTLTLKVSIKPADRGVNTLRVTARDEIALKLPMPDKGTSLYFLDQSQNLCENDPFQRKLELRSVDDPAPGPLRSVELPKA